jgi:hypothetical protein
MQRVAIWSTVLHCVATCRRGDRTHTTQRRILRYSRSSFTPGRPRTRHAFPHRPMPVLALACASTNICGDCRLRCSAPPTSEGCTVCRTRREYASRAAPGFLIGFGAGHARPLHSGVGVRASGGQAAGGKSRQARWNTPAFALCRCGGQGASRWRCARSRGRRIGTCECLLFQPARRLGVAARGTTRQSTWRSLRCPQARRTSRCRSRCCLCERT